MIIKTIITKLWL